MASSRRRPASSSTASARNARCASSSRWRPTSPGSPTSPGRSAASSARSGARPRRPARPPSSRPRSVTPACASSPTTWSSSTSTLEQEVADETALIARRTEVEDGLTGLGSRVAELESAAEAARPSSPRPRTAGMRSPASPSGSPPRGRWPPSGCACCVRTSPTRPATPGPGRPAATPRSCVARRRSCCTSTRRWSSRSPTRPPRSRPPWPSGPTSSRPTRRSSSASPASPVPSPTAARAWPGSPVRSPPRPPVSRRRRARSAGCTRRSAPREPGPPRPSASSPRWSRRSPPRRPARRTSTRATSRPPPHLDRLQAELAELQEAERSAERDRQSFTARVDALDMSLRRKDGAAALLAAGDDTHTIAGSVASLVQVEVGHEVAVAAALGWAGDALAVDTLAGAAAAVDRLRSDDAGRAGLLVAETAGSVERSGWPSLPSGARWAVDVVSCSDRLRPAVDRLLERVALVDSADAVAGLVRDGVTAVTRDGDVFGPGWVRGGSAAAPSLIEIQAAVDEARDRVTEAAGRGERARFAMASLRTRVAEASDAVEGALDQLHDSDAKMSAVAEKLGALGVAVRSARSEAERTDRAIAAAEAALDSDRTEHAGLAERYEAAGVQPDTTDADVATDERDRLDAAATAARAHETELRLALRTARGAGPRTARPSDRARGGGRGRDRGPGPARGPAAAPPARGGGGRGGPRGRRLRRRSVTAAAERADALRRRAEEARTARDAELGVLRRDVATLQDELRELTDSVHRDEVARTQQRLRIEQLETRAVEELASTRPLSSRSSVPTSSVPTPPAEGSDEPGEPQAYVRETQEKRLRSGERRLAALGRINPLALEEFTALEERHTFLTTQLEDLKRSKRDLLDIIREVDERIERGVHRGLPRCRGAVRARVQPAVPGRRGSVDPHRPGQHAHDRARRRGAAAGQEDQAALAALRWRAVPGGRGPAGLDLHGPAVAVLHPRRGGGGARRRQPRPADPAPGGAAQTPASSSSSPTRSAPWRSPTRSTA